jgi:hypothetical protein
MFSLGGTMYDPHIDVDILYEISEYIQALKETRHYREPSPRKVESRAEEGFLPDLLKDFLREELRRQNARDRQHMAFKEAHRVWGDLGFLPLKGRILEIIVEQTVANVLAGKRYEKLTEGMEDLVKGRYGPLYSLANEELRQRALDARQADRGQSWEGRLTKPLGISQEEDVLTYSLFPNEAERFFQSRRQRLAVPPIAKPPTLEAVRPLSQISQNVPRGLSLTLKGEEVGARLEGIGPLRGNKQTMFVNIADMTEEIEVTLVSSTGAMPEYLITMHGETHRLKFRKVFPKEEEYTPIFFEVDDTLEEFLIKHLHID